MPRPDVYPVSIHLTPAQAQRTAQKLLQALQAAQQTAQKSSALRRRPLPSHKAYFGFLMPNTLPL